MTEERIARLNELARKSKTIGLTEAEKQEKVAKALSDVGLLPEFASRFPHEFSGGTQTKLKKKDSPKPPKS